MLAPPAQRSKRARSPTPPEPDFTELDLTSPLDIIIKRRRRGEQPYNDHNSDSYNAFQTPSAPPAYSTFSQRNLSNGIPKYGESSTANGGGFSSEQLSHQRQVQENIDRGIEKRRMKQWERRNTAPIPTFTQAHPAQTPPYMDNHNDMNGGPSSSSSYFPNLHHGPSAASFVSPTPHNHFARTFSQPNPRTTTQMSSSPIRHQPHDINPFSSSAETRVENEDSIDTWDEEELGREWGAEYANQNSLLYNLHRARLSHGDQHNHQTRLSYGGTNTPDTTHLQTPQQDINPQHHHHLHSSPFRHDSLHPGPTPFRPTYRSPAIHSSSTKYHDSSPLPPVQISSDPPRPEYGDEDDGMDGMHEEVGGGGEIKRRYEEANRLLAELEVARRARFGHS